MNDAAQPDLRSHRVYLQALEDAKAALLPDHGHLTDLQDPQPSPDRCHVALVGAKAAGLQGTPPQRVGVLRVEDGNWTVPYPEGGSQRCPRWSSTGRWLAFSARPPGTVQAGVALWDSQSPACATLVPVALPGSVEGIQWVGDQALVLLIVGVQSSGPPLPDSDPDGPRIANAGQDAQTPAWRQVWWLDLKSRQTVALLPVGVNVWEGVWCEEHGLLVLASHEAGENAWYDAHLALYSIAAPPPGTLPATAEPADRRWQIGPHPGPERFAMLRAAPDGREAAFIQGCCSDRLLPSGQPWRLDPATGTVRLLPSAGTDVTHLVWDGNEALLFAGLCGLDTVVGRVDRHGNLAHVLWRSTTRTLGPPRGPECAPWVAGTALGLIESFVTPPTLMVLGAARERLLWTPPGDDRLPGVVVEARHWTAPDGLTIDGWFLRVPDATAPPLVVELHGGPVWAHRPQWLGRATALARLSLLRAGHALLLPNPRGSSGKGPEFAHAVVGDVGGAEVADVLSGIDALVRDRRVVADGACAWGVSHGGFLAAWLACTTHRFAAVAPVSPVTDWLAEHLSGPIPRFCKQFVGPLPGSDAQPHAARSPLLRAPAVQAAVMTVTGALDPGDQAETWHRTLTAAGKRSLLLNYPRDGHGVRTMPAAVDLATRLVLWFGASTR